MKLHFLATFFMGRRGVIFPDGRLFNTRYTEETHSKNSTYREFCASKTLAGGAALYLSNIFLCRPQKNKDSIERLAEEAGKFRF